MKRNDVLFRAHDAPLLPCSAARTTATAAAALTRLHSSTSDAVTVPSAPYRFQPHDPSSEESTIYALSSGGGGIAGTATAVSVIRLTGPKSHDVLRALLVKPGQSLGDVQMPKKRVASLRTVWDPTSCLSSGVNLFDSGDNGDDYDNDDNEDASAPSQKRYQPDPLDSALILTFSAPYSFTGEDVVEIHCHGSRAVVRGILDTLSHKTMTQAYGLRPADRGEFTQRAYGRGKLDLVEVEALADLITADTSLQRKQALKQFDGRLSRLYEGWRSELTSCLAHAEAVIDFGDDEDLDADDVDDMHNEGDGGLGVWGNVIPRVQDLTHKMHRHLSDSQRGEITRDGLRICIVGPPNAGKSSFLNLLSNRDAAIVSPVAGTTRDIVEVTLDLSGVRCLVSDTAGVREEGSTEDIIEVEGIKRARRAAREAHVIVCMVDATDVDHGMKAIRDILEDANDDGDESAMPTTQQQKNQKIVFVKNKVDLLAAAVEAGEMKLLRSEDDDSTNIHETFEISCETNNGIEALIISLTETVVSRVSSGGDDEESGSGSSPAMEAEGAVITRARHRRHVEAAAEALERFTMLSGQGYMALDMAAEELRLAASELGRITGAIDVEDVLDVLFSDFCIGK